jgi:hypothetical protein
MQQASIRADGAPVSLPIQMPCVSEAIRQENAVGAAHRHPQPSQESESAHVTQPLMVRHCTPETCQDPRCPNFQQPNQLPAEKVAKYLEHCAFCQKWAVARGRSGYSGQFLCAQHYALARRSGNER